jgi:hypothetical protein
MARPEVTGRAPLEDDTTVHHHPLHPPSTGPPIGLPRAALTIKEFCRAHGISRAQYYRLKAQGYGPDETRFGEEARSS